MRNFLFALALTGLQATAQKPSLNLEGVPTSEDTSITIEKGKSSLRSEKDFEIVEGSDEIAGDPVNESPKALANWKAECAEWKRNMREMNRNNEILTLNSGTSTEFKEGFLFTRKSLGNYKLKVRVRDSKAK